MNNLFRQTAFFWGIILIAISGMPIEAQALNSGPPFIIDVLMGEPVEMETMLDDLADARIIYLGETHTIARTINSRQTS